MNDKLANRIVDLRKSHPTWGPKRLKLWLESNEPKQAWPSVSTIAALLKSRGLVAERRPWHRTPLKTQPMMAATETNIVWSADFTKEFRVGGRYCFPLVIADDFSRYVLLAETAVARDEEAVKALFEKAFREYGLPWRIRTDNDEPFASEGIGGLSRLSVWWVKLGITPERNEPNWRQRNGRHERMHRAWLAETADPPMPSRAQQHGAFNVFRKHFNDLPHKDLKQQTPASSYTRSSRQMPDKALDPDDYPDGFVLRRVHPNGCLSWAGGEHRLSNLLAGEAVGIEEIGDGRAQLWFGPIYLGLLRKEAGSEVSFVENKG